MVSEGAMAEESRCTIRMGKHPARPRAPEKWFLHQFPPNRWPRIDGEATTAELRSDAQSGSNPYMRPYALMRPSHA
jgi:hypothetical protein